MPNWRHQWHELVAMGEENDWVLLVGSGDDAIRIDLFARAIFGPAGDRQRVDVHVAFIDDELAACDCAEQPNSVVQ